MCVPASCACPAHPPASCPRRQTCALTHYSVKSSITRWFVVSSLWVFKVDHYKHCSKCYERKCTLGFSGGFYTRQAEADYYVYRRSSFRPLAASSGCGALHFLSVIQSAQTCSLPPLCSSSQASRTRRAGFKIDLYIFIYAYIKKEEGEGWIGVVAGWWSLGIRARGGRGGCREVRGRRPWRGGSRGRANSVGGRVECQLIMSLLLTPYVEFFMLSFTSLLNTDKFCVNLQNTHRAFLPRQAHEQLPSVFPCRRSEPANPDC